MKNYSLIFFLLLIFCSSAKAQEGPAMEPFYPLGNSSVAVSVTTSASSAAALTQTEFPSWQEYCVNTGSVPVFVAFGGSSVAATTGGIPIPASNPVYFTLNEGQSYISAITATSTASLYCVGGRGGR